MRLYDGLINRIYELIKAGAGTAQEYRYDPQKARPENDGHEMILQKEMAYELGGSGNPAVNITCMTSDEALFAVGSEGTSRVTVIGSDLQAITGDVPYARISILLTEEMEAEESGAEKPASSGEELPPDALQGRLTADRIYRTLQDIDFVKYHVFPKGYMIRTSGQSGREQVRVGKKALAEGCCFEQIGDAFIKHYLETDKVRQAHVIFITLPDMDYRSLEKLGFQASDIRNSLSKIKNGLPTECSICDIKDICSEVEGLRELHFGTKDRQKRGIRL